MPEKRSRDERLRLVLLCAHPSLSLEAGAALTLRLVLGVSTEDIARLFLVEHPDDGRPPDPRPSRSSPGRPSRFPAATRSTPGSHRPRSIAYLAFTSGYAPGSGADVHRPELAGEAIRLVRVLRDVTEGHPELDALLALMLLQHSRRDARVADDELVLLPDQDRSRWHADEIGEALDLLAPLVHTTPNRWLLEALIASEHAIALTPEETNWLRIAGCYRELEDLTGSPVVRLNRAVAVAEADGPLAGLAAPGRTGAARAPAARRTG